MLAAPIPPQPIRPMTSLSLGFLPALRKALALSSGAVAEAAASVPVRARNWRRVQSVLVLSWAIFVFSSAECC